MAVVSPEDSLHQHTGPRTPIQLLVALGHIVLENLILFIALCINQVSDLQHDGMSARAPAQGPDRHPRSALVREPVNTGI